ncbi:MAG: molybdopterin cofactor-binding domain-containing protein [Acidimicrobiales bacterium]
MAATRPARWGEDRAGRVVVGAGTQEVGTGLPGVISLVAAEALGVPIETVEIRHGHTGFCPRPG